MKTKPSLLTVNHGFTLLEVVITLIVGSILGAILVQFMGTSMKNSFEPVIMVQDSNGVHEIMEKLNSVYKMRLMTSTGNPLDDFRVDVENGMNPPLAPVIGHYTVVTKYITFDVGNMEEAAADPAPAPDVLKVTITHGGQSLTALFTK
jgi:prepilin-type N-terminal cleavage/methylation domain-containing protein